ncbi:MAG: vWA domain-containing protein, partial [Pseudomonadota bacterium]
MYRITSFTTILLYISIAYAGDTGFEQEVIPALPEAVPVEELMDGIESPIADDQDNDTSETIIFDASSDIEVEESGPLLKDVFLVLDNSGSMKKNDPGFLVSEAVKEFISQQDGNTRVGIIIFDQSVKLPVALTEATFANRITILDSLNEINYKGLFTDSPAGVERAIYELKNTGREDAEKSIIFMTDGIVDTGDAEKDIEKAKWLREDLAPDAADNEIKIFGIAFTEAADFQLIQSIAQKTDGEYFRALQAEDLTDVFTRIDQIINEPPEPDVQPTTIVQQIIAPEPVDPVVQAPPPQPVIIEVPSQAMGEEERIRSIIMIAAAIILSITLLAILFLLIRRNKELKQGQEVTAQEAFINDISSKTDQPTH